jgi:polyribonucleotide nucleotidyltransferase
MSEAKVTIDISNDGTILIGSPDEDATKKAIKIIEELTRDVEVGGMYNGHVTRVTNFGAFVEILPGKEGLVHISELADYEVPSVEDVVKVGDEVMVKVTEIDRLGRINLSRRAVFQKVSEVPGAQAGTEQKESSDYPFKKHTESRPPQRHRNEGSGHEGRRPPGGVPPKSPPVSR